jgi:hypothetical protein
MRAIWGALCFGSSLVIATASWAATVEPGQGDLSVNQGQGFQKATGRIDARVGDSVMVSPNGSATVAYSDGCTIKLQPGAVMTIGALSPCAAGSYADDDKNDAALYVIGGGLAAALGFGIYEIIQFSHSGNNPAIRPVSP